MRFAIAALLQMTVGPGTWDTLTKLTKQDLSPDMLWEAYVPATLFFPSLAVFAWLPLFAASILLLRASEPLTWAVGRTQWFHGYREQR
jgi:hypothetical protein